MQIELFTLIATLDPSLCEQTSITGEWAGFTWQVFGWLNAPARVLSILMIWILLPWLIRSWRWKRQTSGVGLGLLLAYLIVASPVVTRIGNRVLVSTLPSDSGATADAIVILGRGSELTPSRVKVAADLWQEQRAPLVFTSGWGDALPMAQQLQAKGVSPAAIDGEPCSRTTEENARFTMSLLQPQGVQRILLVTDPPHMLRSLLTFRSLGVEVIPHPSPLPNTIDRRSATFLVFREYLGLVSYGLLGRFFPRGMADLEVARAAETTPVPLAEPIVH
ncbi:YdcF family protein [Oculatella sp. LEGE 06141]|uniref:YdcF family protein n=1 Tax=Oculatella sp. LEGE 06141 TaxID=1828648 RepID=UPI00187F0457|nr:YdcF family protein [Oculatella sp. LEGE 06141]MBE9180323.1 YdcF family protein [Oculatella sp. LEGE 06141]